MWGTRKPRCLFNMKPSTLQTGFAPVYDENSTVLIMGSFPSVKSREIEFYYGNKQNRFWRMLCGYFQEDIPNTPSEKRSFLLRKKVALWDMVTECEIVGSSDASIKNAKIADLTTLLYKTKIRKILLNGKLAWDLFVAYYPSFPVKGVKMPSTSPANPRYDELLWRKELDEIFAVSR